MHASGLNACANTSPRITDRFAPVILPNCHPRAALSYNPARMHPPNPPNRDFVAGAHGDSFPQQGFHDHWHEVYYRFLETADEYFDPAPAEIPPQGWWVAGALTA